MEAVDSWLKCASGDFPIVTNSCAITVIAQKAFLVRALILGAGSN